MTASRGALSITPLFTATEIGLRNSAGPDHVVKVFMHIGEAVAARWIEMPRGILLLQTVSDRPNSGAIYLYDRERQIFFFVTFAEGRDDSLTTADFDQLVTEYDLISLAANPETLRAAVRQPAMA